MIKGKKGLVIGIANDHSIAWGIAKQLHANGAELAITYQNDTLLKRVKPLADKVNSNILIECDVNNENNLQNTVNQIKNEFGEILFYIRDPLFSTFSTIFNVFSIKLIAFIEIKESFFIILNIFKTLA